MRIAVAALTAFISISASVYGQPCTWDQSQAGKVTESCGKVGIMNPNPQRELDVIGDATISGNVSARDFTLFSNSGVLTRLLAVIPGWLGITANAAYMGGWDLDNDGMPGWFARVSAGHDEFAVYRIPPGSGLHTDEARLLSIQANGMIVGPYGPYTPEAPFEVNAMSGKSILLRDGTVALGAGGTTIDMVGRYDYWGTMTTLGSIKTIKANNVNNDRAGLLTVSVNSTAGTLTNVAKFSAGAMTVVGDIKATGDIRADGVIYAKYQDMAEWVPASQDLAPGTVVVLNPGTDNEVMPSTHAYDTTVAGVVSAQPGLVLGEPSATKETVATTGRVRVRVDARHAPVAIGDLLVTSGRPGYAMKSIPVDVSGVPFHRPGTILGKALQPLAGGEGEILVLLSLQ